MQGVPVVGETGKIRLPRGRAKVAAMFRISTTRLRAVVVKRCRNLLKVARCLASESHFVSGGISVVSVSIL